MSTLGKILAALNILAAVAFVYLAVQDYGKRQTWAHAVFVHDLQINGLPVDENEQDLDGRPLANNLGQKTLQQVVGGQPVKTQKEEVQKRYDQLLAEINGADEARQREILRRVLTALAVAPGEREAIVLRIHGSKEKKVDPAALEDLKAELDVATRPARLGQTTQGSELSLDQRRQAIAHVLYNLGEEPADHQRVAAVVGLKAYTQEVLSEAARLKDSAARVRLNTVADRGQFEVLHKPLLQQLRGLLTRIALLQADLTAQRALSVEHQKLVKDRVEQVADLQAQIKNTEVAIRLALEVQSDLERQLFEAQKAVGAAAEQNRQLEAQLRSREQGR